MKTVRLVDLLWDTENINGYYNFDVANDIAADLGKRLPTTKEFTMLTALPQRWDSKLKGAWFAERKEDLGNPDKSLFLPAVGGRDLDGTPFFQESCGLYWSSKQYSFDKAYYLFFDFQDNSPSKMGKNPSFMAEKTHKLSVRCVANNTLLPTDQCKLAIEREDFPVWANAFLNDNLQDEVAKIISAEVFVNENGNRRFVLMVRIGKYAYTAKGDSSREAAKHIVRAYYAPIVGEQEDTVNVVKIKVL